MGGWGRWRGLAGLRRPGAAGSTAGGPFCPLDPEWPAPQTAAGHIHNIPFSFGNIYIYIAYHIYIYIYIELNKAI